jgi:hypothetical protein
MALDEEVRINREPTPRFSGLRCGCAASIGFLVGIGLPVLFVFSFGMSPCEHGPCDPDGARNFNVAAVTLIALSFWSLSGFGSSCAGGKDSVPSIRLSHLAVEPPAAAIAVTTFLCSFLARQA